MAHVVSITVVLVAVLVAAVTDLWKFKIHNALTLPLLASGLIYHGLTGGTVGFLNSLLAELTGFCILFIFYSMGGMGAGDVKLVAAVGAWLGLPMILYVFIASSLAAGVYAVVLIVTYGRLRETLINFQILWHRLVISGRHLGAEDVVEEEVNRADRQGRIIPFAAMVAVGLIIVLAWPWL